MDYYATVKKNEEVIKVLLWTKKNLQNIIKREKKVTKNHLHHLLCKRKGDNVS